jgi:hypothetical protein
MGTLSNWMARAGYADGSFYVIGSHGHPRDNDHKLDAVEIAARIAAKVVRIRLKPGSGEELRENDVLASKLPPNSARSLPLNLISRRSWASDWKTMV